MTKPLRVPASSVSPPSEEASTPPREAPPRVFTRRGPPSWRRALPAMRALTAPAEQAPYVSFNAHAPLRAQSEGWVPLTPNRFLLGANLPWVRYGLDFGASPATPAGGLHAHPESAQALARAFAQLAQDGVEHARCFLLCDGRAGIRWSVDGTPEGLDDAACSDLDVLLTVAAETGLGLTLVLFDAGWLRGERADALRDPVKREALLLRVVGPLLDHAACHPAVEAWDLFDEPDRGLAGETRAEENVRGGGALGRLARRLGRAVGLGGEVAGSPLRLGRDAMRGFLAEAAALVHARTPQWVTVGLASTAQLDLVRGIGLDLYQTHWEPSYGDAALRLSVADLRLDRPLLLGRFPGNGADKSVKTVLDTARCAGYGGAMLWAALPVEGSGGYDGQLAQWAMNHRAQLHHPERTSRAP